MKKNFITSHVAGRVRVRHEALKDMNIGTEFCAFIQKIAGIQCVEHKALTGSLLVYYAPEKMTENRLAISLQHGCDWLDAKMHASHHEKQSFVPARISAPAYPPSTFQMERKKELLAHIKEAFLTSVARGAKGNKKAHYMAGAAVTALSLVHMWRMRHMCS